MWANNGSKTFALSGPLKVEHGEEKRKDYLTPAISWVTSFLPLQGSVTAQCGDKVRQGYFIPTVSVAHTWAKRLHNPSLLGVAHAERTDKTTQGDIHTNVPHRAGGGGFSEIRYPA